MLVHLTQSFTAKEILYKLKGWKLAQKNLPANTHILEEILALSLFLEHPLGTTHKMHCLKLSLDHRNSPSWSIQHSTMGEMGHLHFLLEPTFSLPCNYHGGQKVGDCRPDYYDIETWFNWLILFLCTCGSITASVEHKTTANINSHFHNCETHRE